MKKINGYDCYEYRDVVDVGSFIEGAELSFGRTARDSFISGGIMHKLLRKGQYEEAIKYAQEEIDKLYPYTIVCHYDDLIAQYQMAIGDCYSMMGIAKEEAAVPPASKIVVSNETKAQQLQEWNTQNGQYQTKLDEAKGLYQQASKYYAASKDLNDNLKIDEKIEKTGSDLSRVQTAIEKSKQEPEVEIPKKQSFFSRIFGKGKPSKETDTPTL